ncbi:MAG TPA: carboxypeptidase-like regulatory domain-containing protein, partial [Pyrinomonadaceae bacterium]|nr:carboxypeptidase-like regulatory domain-containing protein [Pyrinomonadaceae bacterium]
FVALGIENLHQSVQWRDKTVESAAAAFNAGAVADGTLRGRVTIVGRQSAAPLKDFHVYVVGPYGNPNTVTDDRGVFELRGPTGTYTMTVKKSGYFPATATSHVQAGQTSNVDIQAVVIPGKLSGQVVIGRPASAAGFSIRFITEGVVEKTTVTNSAGKFDADLPEASYLIEVTKAGYKPTTVTATVASGRPTKINPISMAPGR